MAPRFKFDWHPEFDTTIHSAQVPADVHSYRFEVREDDDGVRHLRFSELDSAGLVIAEIIVPKRVLQDFHEAYYVATRCFDPQPRAYQVDEIRRQHPRAFKRWTPAEDQQLMRLYRQGTGVDDLVRVLQRTILAILHRLYHLELIRHRFHRPKVPSLLLTRDCGIR